MENKQTSTTQQDDLSIREIFDFVWRLKFPIIICAFICSVCAFFYIRMQDKIYERSAWVMLNNNDGSNSELQMITELSGRTTAKKIDNEVFILKTPSMSRKVVEELDLNYRYFHYRLPIGDRFNSKGNPLSIKRQEYYNDNPFELRVISDELLPEDERTGSVRITFKDLGDGAFYISKVLVDGKKVKLDEKVHAYGESIVLGKTKVSLEQINRNAMKEGYKYAASWSTPTIAAKGFSAKLNVEVQGRSNSVSRSDVVELTMQDNCPDRASEFLNTLINLVNIEARKYSNQGSLNAIEFIDQRLVAISSELDDAESNYKQYQSSQTIVDITTQSQTTVAIENENQRKLNDVSIQLELLKMIRESLDNTSGSRYNVLPANLGLSDAGLNSTLIAYNNMVTERNRMVSNSSENNPRVLQMNTQLDDSKTAILISIDNLERVYNITKRELEKTSRANLNKMSAIPEQQFELQQLGRKLEIIEPLYLMLQQKREETQIKMYSEIDNFRILETAFGSDRPISPKTKRILLLAFLVGCCLPVGFVWLRMQLKTTVETKKDLTDVLDTPILAVLPKSEKGLVLIPQYGRDGMSESFRMLRSNLRFFVDAQVIQVTSSVPGEGKSFVSSNLAISLSHLGKKVLLIGMDLRKPTLHKFFSETQFSPDRSVVKYLVGRSSSAEYLPLSAVGFPGLSVIYAGPVPPNPTELLYSEKIENMIAKYRTMFDYIIIDSAPYLPVPDSSIVNKFVDATLFVTRAEYTRLDLIPQIKEAIYSETNPVKCPGLILNAFDGSSKRYQYGYGNGYGYGYGKKHGYGYGYGYGYGTDNDTVEEKLEDEA